MPEVTNVRVTKEESGQKLFQFLRRRLSREIPSSAIMRWIRTGQVRIDSKRAKPYQRVGQEQVIRIPPHSAPEDKTNHFFVPAVEILHEDNHLLVVNKPPGLPVHPGTGQDIALTTWIDSAYKSASWKPTPVHRLDKDTSGLLVLAKQYATLIELQTLWKSQGVRKVYLAWVQGIFQAGQWLTLDKDMEKTGAGTGRERVQTGKGKKAVTEVLSLHEGKEATLIAARLHTGRTHQIRAHLQDTGHPVVGDLKYGGPSCGQGMLLHSWHLSWKEHDFTINPPWEGNYKPPEQCLSAAW